MKSGLYNLLNAEWKTERLLLRINLLILGLTKMIEEVKVIENLVKKLQEKFPCLIEKAKEEFLEFYGKEIINNIHCWQFFYGWLFNVFILDDGKDVPCLCREILDLDKKENILLGNIEKCVNGFFKIIKINKKEVTLVDLLTKREYLVHTIDFDNGLKEGRVIEAKLVKNFVNNYFFFGGAMITSKSEIAELNLLEYFGDLDVDELVKREMLIIEEFMRAKDIISLEYYLERLFELNYDEVKNFLDSDGNIQKEIIKDKIIKYIVEESEEE